MFLFSTPATRETTSANPDGSLVVSFRAGGLLELTWHLFTWGGAVEILAPDRLRALLVEELRRALARHDPMVSPSGAAAGLRSSGSR